MIFILRFGFESQNAYIASLRFEDESQHSLYVSFYSSSNRNMVFFSLCGSGRIAKCIYSHVAIRGRIATYHLRIVRFEVKPENGMMFVLRFGFESQTAYIAILRFEQESQHSVYAFADSTPNREM
mgnify:CR=1 FL=1